MRVGITMGDPRGVGPEITRAALAQLGAVAEWTIYGPPERYAGVDARFEPPSGAIPERDAIERSAAALREGSIDAVVTAPVAKRCFGGDFPGHTELYAARLGVVDFAMMLAGPRLRVVPVTIHVPLAEVPRRLTTAEVVRCGRLAARSLRVEHHKASMRMCTRDTVPIIRTPTSRMCPGFRVCAKPRICLLSGFRDSGGVCLKTAKVMAATLHAPTLPHLPSPPLP